MQKSISSGDTGEVTWPGFLIVGSAGYLKTLCSRFEEIMYTLLADQKIAVILTIKQPKELRHV
jgi:hypothetical protein